MWYFIDGGYTDNIICWYDKYHEDIIVTKELGNHLAKIIKECSENMNELETGSNDWSWIASKKSLAESLLIKFI